jgi:hypothetical protein
MLWEVRAPATIFAFAGHLSVLAAVEMGKLIVFMGAIKQAYWDCRCLLFRLAHQSKLTQKLKAGRARKIEMQISSRAEARSE